MDALKIGLSKHKMDLSIKHIYFELNGEKHFISFKFSHRAGISDVLFDSQKVKIIDAYPSIIKVIKIAVSIIFNDLSCFMKRFFHHKK